jgi:hypothetical protein
LPSASSVCSSISSNPSSYGPIDETYGSDNDQPHPLQHRQSQHQQQQPSQAQPQPQHFYRLDSAKPMSYHPMAPTVQYGPSSVMYDDGSNPASPSMNQGGRVPHGYVRIHAQIPAFESWLTSSDSYHMVRNDTPETPFFFDV